MHPLTKITDTMFCVEVEKDATAFSIINGVKFGQLLYVTGSKGQSILLDSQSQTFEILGYCDKESISFPVENFLEEVICRYEVPQRAAGFMDIRCYKNYMAEHQYGNAFSDFKEDSKELSFRSLLLSKGLYWDNPMGNEEEPIFENYCTSYSDDSWEYDVEKFEKDLA